MEFRASRTERRIKYGLLILAIVLVAVVIALYFTPGFRLDLAQRLGIVPGNDAVQVAGPGEARLVVISTPVPVALSNPRYRQEARYLVRSEAGGVTVTDLADGRSIPLPIQQYDAILIASDRTRLLFRGASDSATLDIASANAQVVQGNPAGDWSEDVYVRESGCAGSSSRDTWSLCVVGHGRGGSRFLFGDWEVRVRRFGTAGDWQRIYRGRGLFPIVGFAPDEKSVYMYNELGIWRAPIE